MWMVMGDWSWLSSNLNMGWQGNILVVVIWATTSTFQLSWHPQQGGEIDKCQPKLSMNLSLNLEWETSGVVQELKTREKPQ